LYRKALIAKKKVFACNKGACKRRVTITAVALFLQVVCLQVVYSFVSDDKACLLYSLTRLLYSSNFF